MLIMISNSHRYCYTGSPRMRIKPIRPQKLQFQVLFRFDKEFRNFLSFKSFVSDKYKKEGRWGGGSLTNADELISIVQNWLIRTELQFKSRMAWVDNIQQLLATLSCILGIVFTVLLVILEIRSRIRLSYQHSTRKTILLQFF